MIFDANGRAATNAAPPPLYPPQPAISHRRFSDTPPDMPRAEKLPELCNLPGNARINNLSYPTFWMRWWRASAPSPFDTFASLSLFPLSDASISSSLQLDTFPGGLYYAYSLERMLCKSGLENRFLIAARKKSGDFASAHFLLKRVANVLHVRSDEPRGDSRGTFLL